MRYGAQWKLLDPMEDNVSESFCGQPWSCWTKAKPLTGRKVDSGSGQWLAVPNGPGRYIVKIDQCGGVAAYLSDLVEEK